MTTTYWRIYKPEDNLTKYYTCQICKFMFADKGNREKASVELRGIENQELLFEETTEGQILRVCEAHFNELKQAGEIEYTNE
jgi:hypothetical protein